MHLHIQNATTDLPPMGQYKLLIKLGLLELKGSHTIILAKNSSAGQKKQNPTNINETLAPLLILTRILLNKNFLLNSQSTSGQST